MVHYVAMESLKMAKNAIADTVANVKMYAVTMLAKRTPRKDANLNRTLNAAQHKATAATAKHANSNSQILCVCNRLNACIV